MMARLAINAGLDVDVVTTNAAGPKYLNLKDGAIQIEDGVNFHYFQCNFLPNWFFAWSMRKWLELHIKKYDVVHLHVPFTAPFIMGAKICHKFGVPFVISLHGLIDPWCLKQKSWKKIPYLHLLEKKNLQRAKLLHATSIMEAEFVKSLNLSTEVIVLPLAVHKQNEPTINRSLTDHNKIRLLFLGRLHAVKALPCIFKAIRIIADSGLDIELNIAGVGDSLYELDLKKIAINEGVDDRIYWLGHVDEAVRSELFIKANLFVMPSYHENFGLAAAEAMASGLPVILSDQVGLASDVIEFSAGLIVPCDDPSAIAVSVQTLMNAEKWLVSSMGAQELVRQKYGYQTFAKGLLSLYKKACV